MIKGIVILNNSGVCRLSKLYVKQGFKMQAKTIREIYNLVSRRSGTLCNFVDKHSITIWGDDTRLIYRHYATLYFVFACDVSESELAILDLIQVFVETLDKCFENVCELDLIFHSEKVQHILAEIVMGGMVLETNITLVLKAIREMEKHTVTQMPKSPVKNKSGTLQHQKMFATQTISGGFNRAESGNQGMQAGGNVQPEQSHIGGLDGKFNESTREAERQDLGRSGERRARERKKRHKKRREKKRREQAAAAVGED